MIRKLRKIGPMKSENPLSNHWTWVIFLTGEFPPENTATIRGMMQQQLASVNDDSSPSPSWKGLMATIGGSRGVHESQVEVSKTLGITGKLIGTKSVNIKNLAHCCNKRSNISSPVYRLSQIPEEWNRKKLLWAEQVNLAEEVCFGKWLCALPDTDLLLRNNNYSH